MSRNFSLLAITASLAISSQFVMAQTAIDRAHEEKTFKDDDLVKTLEGKNYHVLASKAVEVLSGIIHSVNGSGDDRKEKTADGICKKLGFSNADKNKIEVHINYILDKLYDFSENSIVNGDGLCFKPDLFMLVELFNPSIDEKIKSYPKAVRSFYAVLKEKNDLCNSDVVRAAVVNGIALEPREYSSDDELNAAKVALKNKDGIDRGIVLRDAYFTSITCVK